MRALTPARRADALTFTDIAKEAATGKAYLHAHLDNAARPVIIVRCAKHLTNASPLMESQRLCVHICDRAVERLSPEQQTMLGIFDLRGFTSRNADLGFVRFLVDIFFTYYPKRLSQVLFVEAPWAFKPGWEMIKPVSERGAIPSARLPAAGGSGELGSVGRRIGGGCGDRLAGWRCEEPGAAWATLHPSLCAPPPPPLLTPRRPSTPPPPPPPPWLHRPYSCSKSMRPWFGL